MMRDTELRELLHRIDHKGYPAYKETKGKYQFSDYALSIDHVQGDPFAAPSRVHVEVVGEQAGFDKALYSTKAKRIALEDHLLRRMNRLVRDYSFKAKGSGKSGLIHVSSPGQEILERSACVLDVQNGNITLRMEIGFPANGRTINAKELEKILFDFLPVCVKQTLFATSYHKNELQAVAQLAEDQQFIREELKKRGLVAFVANGSILPRKSGVSALAMRDAVLFQSPKELEVELQLPNKGFIKGMGIRKGVTLIVGGGYHGKSTLLNALELGVYNHIKGDGREYVITEDSAMKLRAEDGRNIQKVDISMFIRNLPNGKDTEAFYSEDASGSTSQAANTVEAIEAGAKTLLIDEDTSATNFMIRDELMQRVVQRDVEPIIPFIDRVRELFVKADVSTILVAGSSGSYFHKADTIIQMNHYEPFDVTEFAKKEAMAFPIPEELVECYDWDKVLGKKRVVKRDDAFIKEQRVKTKVLGKESIAINKEVIDLRYVEQIVDAEQLNALAQIVKYMKQHLFEGNISIGDAVQRLDMDMQQRGFESFTGKSYSGDMVMPRKQEIFATLNRCRNLLKVQ